VLGGYHNFMISTGSGFHKVWYPLDTVLFQKHSKIFTLVKGINIFFKKIKLVFIMLILKNLRTAGSPLLVFTNRVLLFLLKINF